MGKPIRDLRAIREQSIPFELKPYDEYYSGARMERLTHSIGQAERGETITKTIATDTTTTLD
jgi:hypothetical protein